MVVKDEAAVIARCIESVRPLISAWTIVDTGSSDETPGLVEELLAGIPGTLHRRDWDGFGANKTEALELARDSADSLLIVDADMTVEGSLQGPLPRADKLLLTVRDSSEFEYRLPLLISSRPAWRYEGVIHEYLTADEATTQQNLDGLTVTHHCDGARRPEKLYTDLVLLTSEFARSPADARTVFYLAQTHRDLGNIAEAIVLYRLRAEMGGWDEEVFYARYQLGCLLAAHVSFEQGATELLRAWQRRPGRIEPLRALANAANHIADRATPPDDLLFLHTDLYGAK